MKQRLTEPAAKKEFRGKVPRDLFELHAEVKGIPNYTKPIKRLFQEWGSKTLKDHYKIDFVLTPTDTLKRLGWDLGPVGVEVKKSELNGNQFGKAVSQIFDYQAARFSVGPSDPVELSMIFLYPFQKYGGVEASILMQEGIGVIRTWPNWPSFEMLHGDGSRAILKVNRGEMPVYRRPCIGKRTGNRG